MGREQSERFAGEALALARDQEGGQPAGAGAFAGAGEDRVDVGFGSVGDPDLLAVQPVAIAVAPGLEGEGGDVGAGLWLGQSEAGCSLAGGDPGQPLGDQLGPARLQQREAAEALEREGGLGRSRAPRQTLADQAEVEGGKVQAPAFLGLGEEPRQQPLRGKGPQQRPVDRPLLVGGGERRQGLAGELARRRQQLSLLGIQVGVEGGGRSGRRVQAEPSTTATAISSIRAASSNSRVTPKRPLAG